MDLFRVFMCLFREYVDLFEFSFSPRADRCTGVAGDRLPDRSAIDMVPGHWDTLASRVGGTDHPEQWGSTIYDHRLQSRLVCPDPSPHGGTDQSREHGSVRVNFVHHRRKGLIIVTTLSL